MRKALDISKDFKSCNSLKILVLFLSRPFLSFEMLVAKFTSKKVFQKRTMDVPCCRALESELLIFDE
jgi:hypothetical protein